MPEEVQGQQEPNLDGMSLEELEKLASEQVKAEEAQPSTTEGQAAPKVDNPSTPASAPAPVGATKAPDGWIEIDVDGTEKLRFKNQDEVLKSFANAQRLIRKQNETFKRYNEERSEFGQVKQENERLSSLIKELQQGSGQVQRGQSPNVTTQNTLQSLMRQQPGLDPSSALYAEIEALKTAQAQLAARAERFEHIEQQILTQKQEQEIQLGVRGLYQEVDGFLTKHPELKTSTEFAKLDDLVSTYGEEAAQTMMSPEDYAKYSQIFELVGLYKNGPSGLDLTRKNFNDLEEAYLVHQHRTGSLGQALANATKAGIQNYEQVLNRTAQSATTLPNNLSGSTAPEMGPAEIESILNMDPALLNSDPKLKEQFERAAKALGVNLIPDA